MAGLLGIVHGDVGAPHQGFSVVAMFREQGDTSTGFDIQMQVIQLHGLGNALANTMRHLDRLGGIEISQ